jgi:hypothetical protein
MSFLVRHVSVFISVASDGRHLFAILGQIGKAVVYKPGQELRKIPNLFLTESLMLRDSVPILDTFAATRSRCMLSIVKRVTAFPSLSTVEGRFSRGDRLSNSILSSPSHSDFAFPAGIVEGFDINIEVPEVMPNQLIFQRTPGVFNIPVVSLVHSWKINKVSSAVPAVPSLNMLFAAFLRLKKTMKTVVTSSTSTCHLSKWFALFARHLVIPFPTGPD